MTNSMKLTLPLLCATALTLFTGCATPGPSAPPSQTRTATCKVPEVAALPETKESQEKGGVEITLTPVGYEAVKVEKTTFREVGGPNVLELMMVQAQERPFMVIREQTVATELQTKPSRIAYLVKINNKLSRVFRGAGTVVQFNVGGKLMSVNQSGYSELTQAIVPPRSELQVTIYGPPLTQIADKTTLGLFLYDVVTATDAAGNTVEKQNYEWYFSYSTKVVEQTVESVTTKVMNDRRQIQQQEIQDRIKAQHENLQQRFPGNSN